MPRHGGSNNLLAIWVDVQMDMMFLEAIRFANEYWAYISM
jgi:hypothetical protein